MSQFIQSEIRLIHTVAEPTPTEPVKPTEPKVDDDGETKKVDDTNKDASVGKKLLNASVVRRAANLVMKTAESQVNRWFDNRIYAQSFVGNSRGARKIQNEKAIFNAVYTQSKALVGGSVTAYFIGGAKGTAILGLQALNLTQNYLSEYANFQVQVQRYNDMRDKELFTSRYSRDRLNWFNRRR